MTVILSESSQNELLQIQTWVEENSGNIEVTRRYMQRLFNSLASLETFPEKYPLYRRGPHRMMVHENYLIFYRIEDEACVRVVHIRHGARSSWEGHV